MAAAIAAAVQEQAQQHGRAPEPARGAAADAEQAVGGATLRAIRGRFDEEDFFGHQPTPTSELPDPGPLLENLTRCVVEILAGARELDQIARWVSDDVYRHLLTRVALSARAREARGQKATRPSISIGSRLQCEPRDGVVEATVVVRGRSRARAVAIRLEGLDRRWRATAIHVL
ncbi:MAG: hypothetical protein J0G30_05970 [Actinomycetales bacterium]|nr:hypothetical protein [Actinomycetales bacterium]